MVLTTSAQVLCYALLDLTGRIWSKQYFLTSNRPTDTNFTHVERRLSYGTERLLCLVTNGHCFYTLTTVMIQRTRGTVFFVVLSLFLSVQFIFHCNPLTHLAQAYKHVFTSPSSVDKEPKATRSGNARIHGMTRVTLPSIAYIATQVRVHVALLSCVTEYCF